MSKWWGLLSISKRIKGENCVQPVRCCYNLKILFLFFFWLGKNCCEGCTVLSFLNRDLLFSNNEHMSYSRLKKYSVINRTGSFQFSYLRTILQFSHSASDAHAASFTFSVLGAVQKRREGYQEIKIFVWTNEDKR